MGAISYSQKKGIHGVPIEHVYIVHNLEDGKVDGSKETQFVILQDVWTLARPPLVSSLTILPDVPGRYKISFTDFLLLFDQLILIKDFPDAWKAIRIDVDLNPAKGAPNTLNSQWLDENSQFPFDLMEEDNDVCFRTVIYDEYENENFKDFGFAVFQLDPAEVKTFCPGSLPENE